MLAKIAAVLSVFLVLFVVSTTEATTLAPDSILVANGNFFTEYTPTGTVVQKIPIPIPPGYTDVVARDIVVDSQNRVHIEVRGAFINFAATLATLDLATDSWSYHTIGGWTMSGVTYFGGIGINESYVFATDNDTGPGPIDGLIRFPLANLTAPQRFHEVLGSGDNIWHQAKIGLDGFLYSLNRDGVLRRYDPDTMAILSTIDVFGGQSVSGVAIAANGHIYTVDLDNELHHFDAGGGLLETVSVAAGATDIEIAPDGTLIVGSASSRLTVLNIADLSSQFAIDTTAQAVPGVFSRNFVGFAASFTATAVPEPSTFALGILGLLSLGLFAWRRRRRA